MRGGNMAGGSGGGGGTSITTRTHTWWATTWGTSLSSGSTSGAASGRHEGHAIRAFDENGTDGETWAGVWTGFPGWTGADGNIVILCALASSGTANMEKTIAVRMCPVKDGVTLLDIEPNSGSAQTAVSYAWAIDGKAGTSTIHIPKVAVTVADSAGYLGAEQDVHSFSIVISDTGSVNGPNVKVHAIGFESTQYVVQT